MIQKKKKKWIPRNLKKGALRRQAVKEGAISETSGNIDKGWIRKKIKKGGLVAKRAALALTFSNLKKKGT